MEENNNVRNKFDALHIKCGPVYRDYQLQEALTYMKTNELRAIYHLTESHVPGLRERTILRFDKLSVKESPQILNKKFVEFDCSNGGIEDKVSYMIDYLNKLPKEWQIIQITSQYNLLEVLNRCHTKYFTSPLHICAFNSGQNKEMPICVTTDISGSEGLLSNLRGEMKKIEDDINTFLNSSRNFYDQQTRKKKVAELEYKLMDLIKSIEERYLQEWKCLFVGKYREDKAERKVRAEVEKILDENSISEVNDKIKTILYYFIKGYASLKNSKDKRSILSLISPDANIQKNINKRIADLNEKYKLKDLPTYPILLIVDEKLDVMPWELTQMLENKSVTRMPSLHFIYGLYKEHEESIINGFKIIKAPINGKYILNPDSNLSDMERRLTTFIKYWLPNWSGLAGVKPEAKQFSDGLIESDLFVYSGHGSGLQYISSEAIESFRVNAVVLLFGCKSSSLQALSQEIESFGTHYAYLISCSPCVLGMLYQVTDFDTDCLTTALLSEICESDASLRWKYVDKVKWHKNDKIVVMDKYLTQTNSEVKMETELLRAVVKAKRETHYYMTKAAFVCRGLPVKIVYE